MKTAFVTSLGCKVNQYEVELFIEKLEDNGFVVFPHPEGVDVCIVNTCAVTAIASRKSRQMIRKLRKMNPNALVIAVGCHSKEDYQKLEQSGADIVLNNQQKSDFMRYIVEDNIKGDFSNQGNGDGVFLKETIKCFLTERTRAYVKVQDGCDQVCSYCLIPSMRGVSIRSKPPELVVQEVKSLVSRGYKEIVFTGINLGRYGAHMDFDLATMLKNVDSLTGDFRIRLSSINVEHITDELLKFIRTAERMCPHLHIPIQSGSDKILSLMNRHYYVDDAREAFAKLRDMNEHFSITTDIIVGFPGETLGEFSKTLKFIEESEFSRVHVFKYSPRPNTLASKLSYQIPADEKNRRTLVASQLADEVSYKWRKKNVGKLRHVLVEKKDGDICWGYDEYYVKHEFVGGRIGSMESVVVKKVNRSGVVSKNASLQKKMA